MKRARMICLFLFLCFLAGCGTKTPDTIFYNAVVYTVNTAQPRARAIAVGGDRVLAVGDDDAVLRLAGARTTVVDLQGACVVPGLIDAHCHPLSWGWNRLLNVLDFSGATSKEEVLRKIADRTATTPAEQWIIGVNWDQNDWADQRLPTRADLDTVAPDHPVALSRVCGHALWANSKALELSNISADTPQPAGGKIEKDPATGQPTGILLDYAMALVKVAEPTSPELIKKSFLLTQEECLRLGLTGIHVADHSLDEFLLGELHEAGQLKLRVYAMSAVFSQGPQIGLLDHHLTMRSYKVMFDGSLGSRGAALLADYADDPGNRGHLDTSVDEVRRIIRAGLRSGIQINCHAIGDRANRLFLDLVEEELRLHPVRDHRFRSEHAQVISPQDIPRFARLGVIASMQPTHCTSDMPWAPDRLGPVRIHGAYAWQTLLDSGARLALGSDFPVESINPLWGFYAAITRQDHTGQPASGWAPEERLTREEALRGFTLDAAYAAFEENIKGSLEPGKLADFVVLSDDIMAVPPAHILKTSVLRTVIGGQTANQAPHTDR